MNIQIFGTKKCQATRAAERFFKERSVKFQFINLAEKGLSPGELRTVASAVGGVESLIDTESKRYVQKGLRHVSAADESDFFHCKFLIRMCCGALF